MSKNKIISFLKNYFWLAVVFFTLPLFFYKLGQSSLVSFDEAWYAAISKNIVKTGDLFNLQFNTRPFLDHPPFGFWLTAANFKIFGISEFSARLSNAFLGFSSLIILFLIGKKLFNSYVGFFSALALSSSPWFLFRARSGNLDVILVFMFLLTLYLALKSPDSKKYLIPFSFSLSLLVLTKTAVPFTFFPVLLLIFLDKRVKLRSLLMPLGIFILIVGGYFLYQFLSYSDYARVFLRIGLPGVGIKTSFSQNITVFQSYLHQGIGKWFWPGLASLFLGLFLGKKKFYILFLFAFSFSFFFLFSGKTQIWHLIPLYPIMILSFFGFSYSILEKFKNTKIVFYSGIVCLSLVSLYFSYKQIKRNWFEFVNIPAFVSDEAILSREAGMMDGDLFVDGDFLQTAVFYSGKKVDQTTNDTLKPLFSRKDSFLVITYQWRLDRLGISSKKYEIIKKDRDKILIRKI